MKTCPNAVVSGVRASRRWLVVALVPWFAACATAPTTPRALTLPEVVDSVATTPPLDRTHWGVEVYDPATGRTLVDRNAERHFVPASNMKLVVTAVALAELGPEHRYRTELVALGDPTAEAARALLVLGRGDPTLSARYHATDTAPLEMLADSLAAYGVHRIAGDLIIDASYFQGPSVHPSWESGDLPWGYAAPTSAFAIGEGAVRVVLEPGAAAGEPAAATLLAPAGTLALVNELVTDTLGANRDLAVRQRAAQRRPQFARPGTLRRDSLRAGHGRTRAHERDHYRRHRRHHRARQQRDQPIQDRRRRPPVAGARAVHDRGRGWGAPDTLIVTGTLPLDAKVDTITLAVPDPTHYSALAFATVLRDRGVAVDGRVRVLHDVDSVATLLAGTNEVARIGWESPPLSEIVAGTLQPSQNWIAEQLLKTLGAELEGEGSWAAGLDVERRHLFDVVGLDSAAVVLRDGSGLSVQNLLTPRAVVQLLDHARDQPWGEAYRVALPWPGGEGTLEERMPGLETNVRAKTGTVVHVNSLSGYAWTRDGHMLIFSILSNASGRPAAGVRRAIDRITHAIVRGGTGR